jgi:hypothetical protein
MLLRNGTRREYAIIFGRHGAGVGYVYARVDVSFGRLGEPALVKALTGREPRIIERSGDRLMRRGASGRLQALRRACRRRREVRKRGGKSVRSTDRLFTRASVFNRQRRSRRSRVVVTIKHRRHNASGVRPCMRCKNHTSPAASVLFRSRRFKLCIRW